MVNTDSAAVYVRYAASPPKQGAIVFKNNADGNEIDYLIIGDDGSLSDKTIRVKSKDSSDADGEVYEAHGQPLAATVISGERVRVYTFNADMEIIELCLDGDVDAKTTGESNKWFKGQLSTEALEWNQKEVVDKKNPPPKTATRAKAAPNSSITALSELDYTAVGAPKTSWSSVIKVYFNPAHNPNVVAVASFNGTKWSAKELRK